MEILGVPAPDVYILYDGLISNVDQTAHEHVVRDRHRPQDYSIRTYRKGALFSQFEVVVDAQTCYRTLGGFFCSALFGASYFFYDSVLHAEWDSFIRILCPIPRVVQEFVNQHGLFKLLRDTGLKPDSNSGGKEFKSTLRGYRVQLRAVEKFNSFPGADWYCYETLRILG